MMHMLDEIRPRLEESDEDGFGLVFLGDYVDRGILSIEVLIYLCSLKINYNSQITLLRGNHETEEVTTCYTFRKECIDKYDIESYELVLELFNTLPLACIVNNKFLCIHGGISPDLMKIDDINTKINRFEEPKEKGSLCDLLWSDPASKAETAIKNDYTKNRMRMISFVYGLNPVKNLLSQDNLLCLVRAHECKLEGYELH